MDGSDTVLFGYRCFNRDLIDNRIRPDKWCALSLTMVCLAGFGRIVLIGVNATSAIVALVFIACGCLIKYFLGDILKSDVIVLITQTAFALFVRNSPVPQSIDFGPLTDNVGVALIVFGSLLLILSAVGCLTACCNFKVLLIIFSALIGILIVGQIITWSVFLTRNSVIHNDAKKSLEEDLINDYNRLHINSFTISADIIFLAAECCGVEGPDDFKNNSNLRFNFSREVIDPEIPPSCCQRQYLEKLNWDCAKNKTMGHSKGCYDKLQDIVESWYPWLVPVILISMLVQVGEIIAAVIIYKDDSCIVL